ncbi:hypothetical protein ACLOJK_003945 [Asimina triloba]
MLICHAAHARLEALEATVATCCPTMDCRRCATGSRSEPRPSLGHRPCRRLTHRIWSLQPAMESAALCRCGYHRRLSDRRRHLWRSPSPKAAAAAPLPSLGTTMSRPPATMEDGFSTFGFSIFAKWVPCCTKGIGGSESTRPPRQSAWNGSSIWSPPAMLAAGSHGCRPLRK